MADELRQITHLGDKLTRPHLYPNITITYKNILYIQLGRTNKIRYDLYEHVGPYFYDPRSIGFGGAYTNIKSTLIKY